jgi:ERF superfamily
MVTDPFIDSSDDVLADTDVGEDTSVSAVADLVAALSELTDIRADELADTGTYKYKYASLEAILRAVRPVLAEHRLAVRQSIDGDGEQLTISTELWHASGHVFKAGRVSVRMPGSPQQVGSAASYFRRYELVAALGIAAGTDDDGQAASKPAKKAAPRQATVASEEDRRRRHAMVLIGRLGYGDDRQSRLALWSAMVGRDVGSWNDLNQHEQVDVIAGMQEMADEQDAVDGRSDQWDAADGEG